MSLAGFKKQFNKASQYVSEKVGGAKGTELDEDFVEMERKIDVMGKLVEDLSIKTLEYLQPNPASRAKMSAVNSFQKVRGQAKNTLYPQPECILGEHMQKHGTDLGEESLFGQSLIEAGESFKRLGEVKYSLEENVRQNFLDPLGHLQNKDLKEVNHHRKKMSGRRLDFDCKRRKKEKGSTITDEDLRVAEEKFDESKSLAENAMHNIIENEVEQIAQLQSLIESNMEYHRQAVDILQDLVETIEQRRNEAASRPKMDHIPKRATMSSMRRSPSPFDESDNRSYTFNNAPAYESNKPALTPLAEALYDFEPENEGELGFQEGEMVTLLSQIDENWLEGTIHNKVGYFPVNYVRIVNPL